VHTVDTSHSPYSAIFRKKEEDLFLFDLIMRVIMNEVGEKIKTTLNMMIITARLQQWKLEKGERVERGADLAMSFS
jgi:hypothetical protein